MTEDGPLRMLVAENDVIVAHDLCEIQREAADRGAGLPATAAAAGAPLTRLRVGLARIEPRLKHDELSRTMQRRRKRGVSSVPRTIRHRTDPITRGFGHVPWLATPAIPGSVVIAPNEFANGSL